MVTSAAYLLFYRRRSDTPLGGPKFREIIDTYDNLTQETSDSESGEGQRLGHGSSPRGSSSALQTGAGATLRSGRGGSGSVLTAGGDGDDGAVMLPDYGAVLGDDADGLPGLHDWENSNMDDEGIDMREWNQEAVGAAARRSSGNFSDAVRTGWDFANLPGASGGLARSEADEGMGGLDDGGDDNDSTTAQNDDDSSLAEDMADEEGSFPPVGGLYPRHFTGDIEPMLQDDQNMPEPGGDYVLPDEPHPDPAMYDANAPPPSYDELGPSMTGVVVTAEQIADEVGHAEHVDQVVGESRVTEIRIEESDDEDAIPDAGKAKRDTTT
jgi:hypothetical protein